MALRRIAQVNLLLMAVVGTGLLGAAQGSAGLPLLAVCTSILAFFVTDLLGRVRISGVWANAAALVAVAFSVGDLLRVEAIDQLVSISNLLVYLQTILMFQEKTVRVGSQLLSLSLLQVVVAAALGDNLLFAGLVVLYAVCGLSAMVLLCFWDESLAHNQPFTTAPRRRRTSAAKAITSPANASNSTQPNSANGATGGRYSAAFYRGLSGQLFKLLVGSTLVATIVFLAMPRYGRKELLGSQVNSSVASTGFSGSVTLNESGRKIFENDALVMRVSLKDPATGDPYPCFDALYFRGGTMRDYVNGKWLPANIYSGGGDPPLFPTERSAGVVRQDIEMEPTSNDALFSVYPVVRLPSGRFPDVKNGLLKRTGMHRRREKFQIGTTGLYDGEQWQLSPCGLRVERGPFTSLGAWVPGSNVSEAPAATRLAGLIAFATETIARESATDNDVVAKAVALEQRLKGSGEFGYTLALPERAAGKDPIEDFVTEHRRGNCEYFASALALMLRSQGIPSRMVSGYHSNDWNSVGGYLQVRQLHAHAWVEAYLAPSQIPEHLKAPGHDYQFGGWLRLDPTPEGEGTAFTSGGFNLWGRIKNLYDHVDLLWRNYVVGFDREEQEENIYGPLGAVGRELGDGLSHAVRWTAVSFGEVIVRLTPLGAIAVFGAIWWLTYRIRAHRRGDGIPASLDRMGLRWPFFGWVRFWRRRTAGERRQRPHVDFYERFERLLNDAGLRRQPGETPLEFAMALGGQFFDSPERRVAARAPRQIVEAYYRVRHGGQTLAAAEQAAVEQALGQLQGVLAKGAGVRG